MDENLSAVLVAVITAGFGFLGILVTQWLSKAKARQLGQKDKAAALVASAEPPDVISHLGALSFHIRENGMVAREGIQDIKEEIGEIRIMIREIKSELGIH